MSCCVLCAAGCWLLAAADVVGKGSGFAAGREAL